MLQPATTQLDFRGSSKAVHQLQVHLLGKSDTPLSVHPGLWGSTTSAPRAHSTSPASYTSREAAWAASIQLLTWSLLAFLGGTGHCRRHQERAVAPTVILSKPFCLLSIKTRYHEQKKGSEDKSSCHGSIKI